MSGSAPSGPARFVVDDNHDAVEMLAAALEAVGYEVVVAYDGPEALARTAETFPDVVLGISGVSSPVSPPDREAELEKQLWQLVPQEAPLENSPAVAVGYVVEAPGTAPRTRLFEKTNGYRDLRLKIRNSCGFFDHRLFLLVPFETARDQLACQQSANEAAPPGSGVSGPFGDPGRERKVGARTRWTGGGWSRPAQPPAGTASFDGARRGH